VRRKKSESIDRSRHQNSPTKLCFACAMSLLRPPPGPMASLRFNEESSNQLCEFAALAQDFISAQHARVFILERVCKMRYVLCVYCLFNTPPCRHYRRDRRQMTMVCHPVYDPILAEAPTHLCRLLAHLSMSGSTLTNVSPCIPPHQHRADSS